MNEMFCFQCEQTAGGKGCTGRAGVCGKKDDTANFQDRLIGALIGLARAAEGNLTTNTTDEVILEGLFTTVTNVSFDNAAIDSLIDRVHAERDKLVPQCRSCTSACSRNDDYDIGAVWSGDENVRSLKSLILFGLKGIAAYAHHALNLGCRDEEITAFLYRALLAVGADLDINSLLALALELGKINLKCMELLDKANTAAYGTPTPVTVPLTVEKGPFIVISGHDLRDLQQLLEQTKDKGINIYTHSEMLPAHGYPKLKAYPHLKGNFGTAWQNQQKEFDNLLAPVLFTTNCLMPVRESYEDRVFTTAVVRYPELVHISGDSKDFSPVINKALELGGYAEDKALTGINGGKTVMTGFAHGTVLSVADTVVGAVKSGALKHIFLVGGCDGARPGRNYYTDFVKQTPKDSIVLTLACCKYRFNDLDLGTLGGLPRIMDMGQCNDAYSAIKVAATLAEVFGCGLNELPLTLVISWYEQKAVAILLTLLHLGLKNILIGPTLPAFISPAVLDILVKNYNLTPITTPAADLKMILG